MKLYKKLNIDRLELISIVGAGGKTSTIYTLAKELKSENKKVLIASTTKMYYPNKKFIDNIFLLDNDIEYKNIPQGSITVIGHKVKNKIGRVSSDYINKLYKKGLFDVILVEADGARKKTIKAPETYEPVIPSKSTKVIGILGLDSYKKSINVENVHRVDRFREATLSKPSQLIDETIIKRLVLNPKGLFKGVSESMEKYLLLNKLDTIDLNIANKIAKKIKNESKIKIIITSMKNKISIEV
ncbi:MAG: putative selenium-dependent hydroxylase accessory protein YqeC [Firmicutes bacterium]|nr:putative selenium-dependent hydroxylase accessory protein YqeC [Bacillota bacterium]